MKSERNQLILKTGMIGMFTVLGFAANVAFAQQADDPVSIRTQGLTPSLAARLIEKGQQGITALTQYINRTRMIHQLNIYDVVQNDDKKLLAQQPAPEQVATVEAKP